MTLSLADFDNKLMDGLSFCAKAYAMFEEIRATHGGISRLRMRPSPLERRLLDEILPICSYIQSAYRLGRYISIRWANGNQKFDAHIVQSGYYVDDGIYPSTGYLEVTCVVHPNEHLSRELLETKGGGFGLEGIRRLKNREIESIPVSYSGRDFVERFAHLILTQINKKISKNYPIDTTLIIQCTLNNIYMPDEWDFLIWLVRRDMPAFKFSEIYICETGRRYSHSFYAK